MSLVLHTSLGGGVEEQGGTMGACVRGFPLKQPTASPVGGRTQSSWDRDPLSNHPTWGSRGHRGLGNTPVVGGSRGDC